MRKYKADYKISYGDALELIKPMIARYKEDTIFDLVKRRLSARHVYLFEDIACFAVCDPHPISIEKYADVLEEV